MPPFEISVFESTSDLDVVSVDSQHLFFTLAQGGLAVAEEAIEATEPEWTG